MMKPLNKKRLLIRCDPYPQRAGYIIHKVAPPKTLEAVVLSVGSEVDEVSVGDRIKCMNVGILLSKDDPLIRIINEDQIL